MLGASFSFSNAPVRQGVGVRRCRQNLSQCLCPSAGNPTSLFHHHLRRPLFKDGVGLNDLGSTSAPAPFSGAPSPFSIPLLTPRSTGNLWSNVSDYRLADEKPYCYWQNVNLIYKYSLLFNFPAYYVGRECFLQSKTLVTTGSVLVIIHSTCYSGFYLLNTSQSQVSGAHRGEAARRDGGWWSTSCQNASPPAAGVRNMLTAVVTRA